MEAASRSARAAVGRDHQRGGFGWREAGRPATRASTAGEGEAAIPIVLLHGLTGSRLAWESQLAALGRTRQVAAWDLPGYGGSDPLVAPVSFAALADAVARFADVLGADRIHLVGLSFGGMIAQYAAAAHLQRVASLTLVSTSPRFGLNGTTVAEWRAARMAPLDAGLQPADFAHEVLARIAGPNITTDELAGQVHAASLVPAASLRTSIDVLTTHDSRALLALITAPTLCVVGELDDETPVEYSRYLAEHIAGAELLVVPGAGHLVPAEAPDTVNAALAAHITRAEARPATS